MYSPNLSPMLLYLPFLLRSPLCLKINHCLISENWSSWQTFLCQCCHYPRKQNYSTNLPSAWEMKSSVSWAHHSEALYNKPPTSAVPPSELRNWTPAAHLCSCRPACLEYSAFPQLHLSSKFLHKLGQVPTIPEFFSCCKLSFWTFVVLIVDVTPLHVMWVSFQGLQRKKRGNCRREGEIQYPQSLSCTLVSGLGAFTDPHIIGNREMLLFHVWLSQG